MKRDDEIKPVSCRSFQYSARRPFSSASLFLRCSDICQHVLRVYNRVIRREPTFASTSSASLRSSSTCLSFSFRSISICSYSRCNRSMVCWLAWRFSSACLCARSNLSCALASCLCTLYTDDRCHFIGRTYDNSIGHALPSSFVIRCARSFCNLDCLSRRQVPFGKPRVVAALSLSSEVVLCKLSSPVP